MLTTGPFASYAPLLAFLPPLLAGSSRGLWKWALAAFLPAALFLALTALPGEAQSFATFLGCFVAACLGTLARRLSLIARGFGHARPGSFWIEGAFFALALLFWSTASAS